MITMYTTSICSDCIKTKNFLDKYGIAYQEINIENDDAAATFVMEANNGKRSVPTLVCEGVVSNLSQFTREKLEAFLQKHNLR